MRTAKDKSSRLSSPCVLTHAQIAAIQMPSPSIM